MICHLSCSTCTSPNDQTKCSKCVDGYYLDVTTCKACVIPCKFCSSSSLCLSCINSTDYTYNSTKNSCDYICQASCKTCSKPNDSNYCDTCNDGYYLSGTKCPNCTTPCSKCQTSAT